MQDWAWTRQWGWRGQKQILEIFRRQIRRLECGERRVWEKAQVSGMRTGWDVGAVPEIGNPVGGGVRGVCVGWWEQIRKPTGLAAEQSGKSYRLVAVWMWTSRQSSKLYQGDH